MTDADDNLVDPAHGCPLCAELRADRLVWLDDNRVECTMCGTVYRPADAAGAPDPDA